MPTGFRAALLLLFLWVAFFNPANCQDDIVELKRINHAVIAYAFKDLNKADSLNLEFKKLVAAQNPPHDTLVLRVYFLDAILNLLKDRYFLAEKYFKYVINNASGYEANLLKENCYNNLGVIYHKRNQLSEALEANLQSVRLAELRKDSVSIVQSWINISLIEYKRKNLKSAVEIGKGVLDYCYRHQDSGGVALCHQNLGIFYNEQKAYAIADAQNAKALELYEASGVVYDKVGLKMNMAGGLISRQKFAEASKLIESVLPEISQKGFEGLMIQANVLRGLIAMDGYQQFEDAEKYFLTAERLSKDSGKGEDLPLIYENLAKLGMNTRRKSLFDDALQKFKTYHEQQFSVESDAAYEEMKVLYELEKEKEKQTELKLEIELRRKQFWFITVVLLILFLASGVMLYQHIRLKSAYTALFRMNVEQFRSKFQAAEAPHFPGETEEKNYPETSTQNTFEEFQQLITFLESEKRFRNQELELQFVATHLQMTAKEVNRVIRIHAGTNFPGLLNKLRIQEARRLILAPGQQVTLKEIAFEVGFNNRISFYRQFKEETGFSPSAFKELAERDMKNNLLKED